MSASASTSSARTDASMNHYLSSSNCSLHIERGVLAAALAVLVCAICSQQCAHALPAPAPAYDFLIKMSTEPASMFSENNECHSSSDVETLCQRCAKATKSNVVYPMCCENKEEAREWCDRYLHFGIQ